MEKIKELLGSPIFKTGFTVLTLGIGGFLFMGDFKDWLNEKLDTKHTPSLTRILTTASLVDNAAGLAWSKFGSCNNCAWKDHAMATTI